MVMWLAFMTFTILISYAVYRWYERYFFTVRDRYFPA